MTGVLAHTILCASPNKDHFKQFVAYNDALDFCMPVWTREELLTLQKCIKLDGKCLSDEEFEVRYFNFGGRIRYVYERQFLSNGVPRSYPTPAIDRTE